MLKNMMDMMGKLLDCLVTLCIEVGEMTCYIQSVGRLYVLPLLAVRLVPRTYLYLVIVQLHLLSRAMQHLHASSNLTLHLALDIRYSVFYLIVIVD